jgi:hypothetical protein
METPGMVAVAQPEATLMVQESEAMPVAERPDIPRLPENAMVHHGAIEERIRWFHPHQQDRMVPHAERYIAPGDVCPRFITWCLSRLPPDPVSISLTAGPGVYLVFRWSLSSEMPFAKKLL